MKLDLNRLFPFLGIRGKLLVAFVGLALGPVTLVGLYAIREAGRALSETTAEHLRLQLQSNIGHIESYLALVDANARMLSVWIQDSDALEGDEGDPLTGSAAERLLNQFAWMRPDYYQVRLLSHHGHELVRIDRYGDRPEVVPDHELQDKSDRYYFEEAMALPGEETYFSPVDLNIERGEVETPQQLVFRVARRVRDRQGRARGLVILNVFAQQILDRLRPLRPEPYGEVLFIGESGRFVREECGRGPCDYTFGQIREHLAAFPTAVVESLLAGETAALAAGRDRFVSYAPIRVGGPAGEPRWRLAIVYPRDLVLGPADRMRTLFFAFATLVAAVAIGLAGLATRTLVSPIHSILRFVQGVAVGDFRQDLTVETRDEIEQLAQGVRETAKALEEAQGRLVRWNEELQAEVARKVDEVETLLEAKHAIERQLRQADRLASLGMLSTSLAHEIGNPLAGMKTAIQVHLRSAEVGTASRAVLEAILLEVDRLAQILERVTGFVRPPRDRQVTITLAEVFRRVAFLLEREARKKGVVVRIEGDGATEPVLADAQKLEQVLLNLMVNALQAVDGPGTVTVGVDVHASGLGIMVADTGPGIPPELRDRVFDPFFTTKEGGTGLGLPIVRQLVGEMKGEIRLEFPESGGTRVFVKLPVPRSQATRREERANP